ncbi:MAG: EamA family transporter [Thermoplasmata archaeon]
MRISKNAAYALLILAVCLWGTAGTVSSIAMDEGASVMQLTAFAFVISSLVFLPLVALFDRQSLRIRRKDIPEFSC